VFSVVESWSGYYWQTRSTVFAPPGGHDWALWRAQTPHMLAVADRWFD
jgi:hypothetical protein